MDADAWRQAKGVLAEALLSPPAERDAIVCARCADPELRREVQAYLNEYDEHFLETVLTVSESFDSASTGGEGSEPPAIHPGDRIGPYVVVDRLGAGGMGQVFLGRDTRLERKVALKCLSAPAPAAELRSRILHEARAAARITHPNIAVVHDVVEHEDRPFLVMEYVEGDSLAALLKRGPLAIDRVLNITRQLASALSAAHATGIVHRDLKPANVQVTPDGSVKILDFGVAHAMSAAAGAPAAGASASTHGTTTAAGTLQADRRIMHPGTPAYMSPEQLFGRPLDQRSDIYSLGIIVYEMATGHRPYSAENPFDIVQAFSREFIQAGGEPPVPPALNGVVARMLAVKPDERYQTAADVEAAVAALIVRAPSVTEAWRPAPRSRIRVATRIAALAIAVPLVVGGLGFLETAAFNLTLGRVAPFDREPVSTWFEFGARALVMPLMYLIGIVMTVAAVRFVVRMLRLSRGIEQLLTTGFTRTKALGVRLGLQDPVVLSQAVATIGVIVLIAMLAAFSNVIAAWAARINTDPLDRFLLLRPGHRSAYQVYHFLLCVFLFALVWSVLQIARLRASQRTRGGRGSFAVVIGMLAAVVILLVLPYRIVYKAAFERVDVGGERCFLIGASDASWLIHCPEHVPPRNRVFARDDAAVRKTGGVEDLFTPPETLH